jgi:drug/metabolite transporter (DMT)-like permease
VSEVSSLTDQLKVRENISKHERRSFFLPSFPLFLPLLSFFSWYDRRDRLPRQARDNNTEQSSTRQNDVFFFFFLFLFLFLFFFLFFFFFLFLSLRRRREIYWSSARASTTWHGSPRARCEKRTFFEPFRT